MAKQQRRQRPINTAKAANATSLERAVIDRLRERLREECPARGFAPPLNQKVSFRSLPISDATLRGLEGGDDDNGGDGGKRKKRQQQKRKINDGDGGSGKNNNDSRNKNKNGGDNLSNKKQFWTMTDIQNACIPHALMGRDILGAARTGR
jgi:superfamily II DNA/RNA helicase